MANDYQSWIPETSFEQTEAVLNKIAKLKSSVGVVDEVLEWLDASINFYGNTDSLGIDESTPDDQIKIALIVAKKMKLQFEQKFNEFSSTYSEYIKPRGET